MSLGSPSVPTAPTQPLGSFIDPFALGNVQQTYNVGAGVANQAGSLPYYNSPSFQQSWDQIGTGPGGVPIYRGNQNFTNPQSDANYNQYLGNQGYAGGVMMPNLSQTGMADIGRANEVLQGDVRPTIGYAQNAMNTADQLRQQYVDPNLNRARDLGYQAWDSIQNGAGGNLAQYRTQDVNRIGNMAEGLTGERMNAAVAGIKPFQTQDRNALDNQLRNQGLHPGMPGYDTAMRQLDYSQNMATNTFMSQFQPQAWQQATQMYQDPLTKAQADMEMSKLLSGQQQANAGAAQTGINYQGQEQSAAAQQGALANSLTNLGQAYGNLGLSQTSQALPWLAASAPTMPPTPGMPGLNIAPVNVGALGSAYNQQLGSNYSNQLAGYNAQLSQNQNMLSGLFGVGSSVLGGLAAGGLFAGSERDLKENIIPLGISSHGIPLYSFNYKWGGPMKIGAMADEVEQIMPEAILEIDGHKLVNYAMVFA